MSHPGISSPASDGCHAPATSLLATVPRAARLLIALATLWALVLVARSSHVAIDGHRYFSLFDDAMVSMRYARNLVEGRGLTWNAGERVEGFTHPAMVFMMAVAVGIFGHVGGVLAVQLIGVATFAMDLWLVASVATLLVPENGIARARAAPLAVATTVFFHPLMFWSIMGMETGLVTLLTLGIVWTTLREGIDGRTRPYRALAATSLLPLVRPDAIPIVAVLMAFRVSRTQAYFRRRSATFTYAAALVAPAMAYLAFRRIYYGRWFPNTFSLKLSGQTLSIQVLNGLAFTLPIIVWSSPVVFVVARQLKRSNRADTAASGECLPAARACLVQWLALFAVLVTYQIQVGGDAWPPMWRFTVPAQVLLFAIAGATLAEEIPGLNARPSIRTLAWFGLPALTLAEANFGLGHSIASLRPFSALRNGDHIDIALALREVTTPQALIAPLWAGTIAYYADRPALDPLGKVDNHVATGLARTNAAFKWGRMSRVPGHTKIDLRYTLQDRRPTYLMYAQGTCALGEQDLTEWCRKTFTLARWKGVALLLRRDSVDVRWDLLSGKLSEANGI